MKAALIAIVVAAVAGFLLTTRLGVFIVFDVFGDLFDETDNLGLSALEGPLTITDTRTAVNELDLPEALEQPSGLHINDQGVFVSTDQAELFRINHDGSLDASQDLLGGPLLLKQGSVESVITFGNDLYVVGELGEVAAWHLRDDRYFESESLPLLPPYDELEYTGLVMFGGSMLAVDGDTTNLHNLTTGKSFGPDFSAVLKEGREAAELVFSGIAADFARLYVITENHTSVLVIHPNGWKVERVIDIDDVEASDIAVYQGLVFVSVDHNYFDERLPVLVYDEIALAPLF